MKGKGLWIESRERRENVRHMGNREWLKKTKNKEIQKYEKKKKIKKKKKKNKLTLWAINSKWDMTAVSGWVGVWILVDGWSIDCH